MKISVTLRNTDAGETWQKEYVDDRLRKLKKYIDHPVEAHIVLSVEKFRNVAEINLMSNGLNVNTKEEAKDMHLAIDNAVDKIERQLKKHKDRIRTVKAKAANSEETRTLDELAEESEDIKDIKLVETRKMVLDPMSVDDAVMKMETSKNRFIVYRDSSTEQVSVIYRREDGKYGLIETNG
jgi:putative sigma-54 modulation protein